MANTGGRGGLLDPAQPGELAKPGSGGTDIFGHTEQKMSSYVNKRNRQNTYKLTRSQRFALENSGVPCWIYNISRLFQWSKHYKGLGHFSIPKAPSVGTIIMKKGKGVPATAEDIKGTYRLSTPLMIKKAYVESYDKGDNRRLPYVTEGQEIAESIVGNSKMYPVGLNDATANLETWGVFITYGKPFDELEKHEQDKLLAQASAFHNKRLFEKVQKGDMLYEMAKSRGKGGPLEIHRKCALELMAAGQLESLPAWVSDRSTLKVDKTDVIECPFCTSDVKATAIVCPQCRNIIDQDKYDAKTKKSAPPTKE